MLLLVCVYIPHLHSNHISSQHARVQTLQRYLGRLCAKTKWRSGEPVSGAEPDWKKEGKDSIVLFGTSRVRSDN